MKTREATRQMQALQDEIKVKEASLRQLMDDKVRISRENAQLLEQLEKAQKEIEYVRDQWDKSQDALMKCRTELSSAREENGVLRSIEEQLNARCEMLYAELQELKEHPRIPLGYKNKMESESGMLKQDIEDLVARLQKCEEQKLVLASHDSTAKDDLSEHRIKLKSCNSKCLSLEERAHKAEQQTLQELFKIKELEKTIRMLQMEVQKKPAEVTRTVYVRDGVGGSQNERIVDEVKPEVKVTCTDDYLLEIFDELGRNADVEGFAPRLKLAERVAECKEQEARITLLVDMIKDLKTVVVDRDDYQDMIAIWRGILPEKPKRQDLISSPSRPASSDDWLAVFDNLDYENQRYVPRFDLRRTLINRAAPSELVDMVTKIPDLLVPRPEFIELLRLLKPIQKTRREMKPYLMEAFDYIDGEGDGMCPREALRDQVSPLFVKCGAVGGLSGTLSSMNEMIIDRQSFDDIVEEWIEGPKPQGKGPPGKGPPGKGPPPAAELAQRPKPDMREDLIKAFDDLDEEGAEMAPRLDLRKSVDSYIAICAPVQELSDTVRNLDAMIVEREEYVELVDAWLGAGGDPSPISEEVPQRSKTEMAPDLIQAFDTLDAEETEMAPRLDLRKSVDEFIPQCAAVQELSDTVRGLDAMIVERDEYVELVEAWVAA